MTTWTLLIWIYAGVFAKGDSMALTTINGFKSLDACEQSGARLASLPHDTVKELRTSCVEVLSNVDVDAGRFSPTSNGAVRIEQVPAVYKKK